MHNPKALAKRLLRNPHGSAPSGNPDELARMLQSFAEKGGFELPSEDKLIKLLQDIGSSDKRTKREATKELGKIADSIQ